MWSARRIRSAIEWKDQTLRALAREWIASEPAEEGAAADLDSAASRVVLMNFTSSPERQWFFVLAAIECAETEDQFSAIAAGPLEHLLGFHGADYIEKVEGRCVEDRRMLRVVRGVWRHKMTDDVWARVERLKVWAKESS